MLDADTGILIGRPEQIWCPAHLEPYRATWPTGYIPATMCILHQTLSKDEEFIESTQGTIRGINACIAEYGPLCCRVEAAQPGLLKKLTIFLHPEREQWTETLRKYGPPPAHPPETRDATDS